MRDHSDTVLLALFLGTALPLGFAAPQSQAALRIGAEAAIPLPAIAEWSSVVNFRPGHGDLVTLNPPIFSWSYTPDPRDCASDTKPKLFVFLVSTNPACNDGFVVAVTNRVNFYNFLAPLTNTHLTHYWKVGYINPASPYSSNWTTLPDSWASTPYAWSLVRQFRISQNATVWDRSKFADEAYLLARSAHPHLLFNATNRLAVSNYVVNSSDWTTIKNEADATIVNAWWPNSRPSYLGDWGNFFTSVALAWQITRDPIYTNGAVTVLTNLAYYFMTNMPSSTDMAATRDWISTQSLQSIFPAIAFGYDWLFDLMDNSQRSNVLRALELRSKFMLYGNEGGLYAWALNPYSGDTNGIYPGGFLARYPSIAKMGNSHPVANLNFSMIGVFAGFGEGRYCRELFDVGLNWLLGVTYSLGFQDGTASWQGREYGMLGLYQRCSYYTLVAQTVFPDIDFGNHPYWRASVDWITAWIPVRYYHLYSAWGETGYKTYSHPGWRSFGDMACLVGSGYAYQHYLNHRTAFGAHTWRHKATEISFPYYSPEPAVSNAPLISFKPASGWYIEASQPANTFDCFTNGVGFVFQARPAGASCEHDYFSDGSFEIWAYGASVTAGGNSSIAPYGHHTMAHNSILVDGMGQVQRNEAPIGYGYYSRFIAYTNTGQFTYIAADLTRAYPRDKFGIGGWQNPYGANYSTAPLSKLLKVHRHILFLRQKYFVIYDDLEATSPATFTTVYHVAEHLAGDIQGGSFQYACTNIYRSGPDLQVSVWQNVDPALLAVTNMAGTNARKNPITGEDFSDKAYDSRWKSNVVWTSSSQPVMNFNFLTVIYPVRVGSASPRFERVDNLTVRVACGADVDVITFNSNRADVATLVVDVGAVVPRLARGGVGAPRPPIGVRRQ